MKLLVCMAFFVSYVGATSSKSFLDKYCIYERRILKCDFTLPEKAPKHARLMSEGYRRQDTAISEEILFLNTADVNNIDMIFIRNFPELSIEMTACTDTVITKSNIQFKDGPVEQCSAKRMELQDSHVDRVPREVSQLVAYSSHIDVLQNDYLEFVDIHDSTIKSATVLQLSSSKVSFFDSNVSFNGKFNLGESSSVKFINSNVSFSEGGYIDVHGELTLQGTTVDSRFINLNPSSRIHILSPKVSRLHNTSQESNNSESEMQGEFDPSTYVDPKSCTGASSVSTTVPSLVLISLTCLCHCLFDCSGAPFSSIVPFKLSYLFVVGGMDWIECIKTS